MNNKSMFDYAKEPSRDILCIDCKSFYASCECAARGLNPLSAKLVVMSYPSEDPAKRGSGLILASSPMAKKAYGISNISRARDLPFPYPKDLIIAPPRMNMYMEMHNTINNIYRSFVDDNNISIFSVDETFLDVTDSLKYFNCDSAYEIARLIQTKVFKETGIVTTIGIGDNPLLAKLALDNEAKNNKDMKAEWRYEDVPEKIWTITKLSNICGIGSRTEKRLNLLGIYTMEHLAHYNYYKLKKEMGIIGTQLYAHAWGIDRSFLGQTYVPKSKSIGNSQILDKDYTIKEEIEIVIREMADQVATRLRRNNVKAGCVGLFLGYSFNYVDEKGKTSFNRQLKVDPTYNSKKIAEHLLHIFDYYFTNQSIRQIGVSCSELSDPSSLQMNLFEDIQEIETDEKWDETIDTIRRKYGFTKLVYASSKVSGGRAIARSSLVGGHAGGLGGIENEPQKKN